MKHLSVEKFRDGIWRVSKDVNHSERERVKVIFLTDGKMEQYESPWVVLPGDD